MVGGDLLPEEPAERVEFVDQGVVSDISPTKLSGTDGLRCTAWASSGSPIAPPSMAALTSRNPASYRRMNPTWTSRRPARDLRVDDLAAHRPRVVARGFSHSTGLPADDAGEHLLDVQVPGRGDQDGVDARILDELGPRAGRPGAHLLRRRRRPGPPRRRRPTRRTLRRPRPARRRTCSVPIMPVPMTPTLTVTAQSFPCRGRAASRPARARRDRRPAARNWRSVRRVAPKRVELAEREPVRGRTPGGTRRTCPYSASTHRARRARRSGARRSMPLALNRFCQANGGEMTTSPPIELAPVHVVAEGGRQQPRCGSRAPGRAGRPA